MIGLIGKTINTIFLLGFIICSVTASVLYVLELLEIGDITLSSARIWSRVGLGFATTFLALNYIFLQFSPRNAWGIIGGIFLGAALGLNLALSIEGSVGGIRALLITGLAVGVTATIGASIIAAEVRAERKSLWVLLTMSLAAIPQGLAIGVAGDAIGIFLVLLGLQPITVTVLLLGPVLGAVTGGIAVRSIQRIDKKVLNAVVRHLTL